MTDTPSDDNVIALDRWRDFNDAEPQNPDAAHVRDFSETTEEIKARMIFNIRGVLSYLLPGGVYRAGKFVAGDVRGNRGDSLSVELNGPKAGMWHDFATGEGGDIIALWAAVSGHNTRTEFPAIMEDIRGWLDGYNRTYHDDRAAKTKSPPLDELGPVTAKWDYLDDDGKLIANVYRYDPPGGKQFRPWDVVNRKTKAPDPRPLYNRPGIKDAQEVVLVEGEKAAQALIDKGIPATTAMNGATAPPEKTDWSPLRGKRVLIWPDKDGPGWQYAQSAAQAILSTGAHSVSVLLPPEDKPAKWDAADAVEDGMNVAAFISNADRQSVSPEKTTLDLADWHATRYSGEAPEQRFLVEGSFPMGVVSILAAMGDTGKGMLSLDLALSVATEEPSKVSVNPGPVAFGGPVREFGTAVIFTAEDDQGEVHRRLQRLDPKEVRLKSPERLIVVPLPNAGGPIPLVVNGKDGPEVTPQFKKLREQILGLRDLKLVVFDPLASFIHADVTSDPAAGSFATGLLASLATETGAAVIVAHHMRKPQGNRPITSVEQARDAVRGTSAIVDGVRMVYALWPAAEDHQTYVFKALDEEYTRNAIYQGAVVKANGPADRTIRTYRRVETGLLVDVTEQLKESRLPVEDLSEMLVTAVIQAAEDGQPFTHTGNSGVFKQRNRLPVVFHEMGRNKIEKLVQDLLNARPAVLVKGMSDGSKELKWLDVPDGPFARGVGHFTHGAHRVPEEQK